MCDNPVRRNIPKGSLQSRNHDGDVTPEHTSCWWRLRSVERPATWKERTMSAQSIPPHDDFDDQGLQDGVADARGANKIPPLPSHYDDAALAHYDDTDLSRYDEAALARYQDLFAHMAVGVVFQDAEGRIIDANPAAQQLLGLTREQLLGLTSFDARWRTIQVDGVEVPGAMHPAMVALRTGKPVRNEIMGVFVPGRERYRWLRVNAIPQLTPGGERPAGVFVTFDDITEWDYLEEGARILISRYQALMEQAADAVFVAEIGRASCRERA